ncbi:MAG: AAC(3)-I family aminoglycoside N-acetyltransferase [Cyanobacteria bacterium J06634_6]
MSVSARYEIQQLTSSDLSLIEALSVLFEEVFGESDTGPRKRPSAGYLRQLLESDYFIAVAALVGKTVVGGIAAYELKKFEQERSEIYLYDLAVSEAHRREGMATALIEELGKIAAVRGASVIFVQADTDVEDQPAIALYTKLGVRHEVLHFDIAVESSQGSA